MRPPIAVNRLFKAVAECNRLRIFNYMEMRLIPTRKFSPAKKVGHGGARRGAGRPAGARDLVSRRVDGRDTTPEERLKEAKRIIGGLQKELEILRNEVNFGGPLPQDWDSKRILEAQMRGEIYASPQQLYAAGRLLPIEYAPAVSVEASPTATIAGIFHSEAFAEFERRALKVLSKHPEALQDWLDEFRDVERAVVIDVVE
jgi:hypothetical protein